MNSCLMKGNEIKMHTKSQSSMFLSPIRVTTLVAMLVLAFGAADMVNAGITWQWNFDSEYGQFVTDGDSVSPPAGTYTLSDFSVTASATGGTIGSLSAGDYSTAVPNYSTPQPFSFVWDGSKVTQWMHSGGNTFDWWSFTDVAASEQAYFFGWDTGNHNVPTRAAHYDDSLGKNNPLAVGTVTVKPVPEPGTVILLGVGGLAMMRRRSVR